MEDEFEEKPRSRVLLVNNEIFSPYEHQREEDFETTVSRLVEFVFGPKTLYFDIRQKVVSKTGRGNVTDGVLLELRKDGSRLWLVEYELSSHDLDSHVQPQIMGFIHSLRNPETLRNVQLALYEAIKTDEDKANKLREFTGSDVDVFFFLDRVLHEKCGVVIIIDDVTPQLSEICEDLERYTEVKVIEFKTYRKDEEEIYQFNPFHVEEDTVGTKKVEEETGEEDAGLPNPRKSWEDMLRWVYPETKELAVELVGKIENELPDVSHGPKYRWYYFYKGKLMRNQSLFAVLVLAKRSITICIQFDPNRFEDRLGITKRYKGWFFKTGERRFSIKNIEQINYALEMVKQAYNLL